MKISFRLKDLPSTLYRCHLKYLDSSIVFGSSFPGMTETCNTESSRPYSFSLGSSGYDCKSRCFLSLLYRIEYDLGMSKSSAKVIDADPSFDIVFKAAKGLAPFGLGLGARICKFGNLA